MGIYIGIDLGTTNSVVCRKLKDLTFVKDASGAKLIPSVVCYTSDETYVGLDATENEENFPSSTIRSSKRWIGKSHEYDLGDHKTTPELVAKDILAYLKQITQSAFNDEIDGVVITVPAYFNQNQRLKTKEAAVEAGLNVLRIINEPTAAALAYGDKSNLNELILVYDLGGGTFDVTLLKLSDDNVYQVLSTSGNTQLGGDDFDNLIVDSFIAQLPPDFKPFKDFRVRLKKIAEDIKIQLNYKNNVKKTMRYCGTVGQKIYHHEFHISKTQYEQMIRPLLLKTKSSVLTALNDADKKISSLSKIILVGGSTKSIIVRDFISNEFNTKVYCDIDPDLTVAAGAANLAQSLYEKNSDSAVLIDVTPLSLGIETKGGLMNKIIPRNASIPITAEQEFITAEDNQTSVNIRIFQGERPMARDNESLGEFELSGFEPRPKGQTKIIIRFSIDASGLIVVSAFDKISGLQSHVHLKSLTSEKINTLLDDSETHQLDDKLKTQRAALSKLNDEIRTLLFNKSLMGEDVDEYQKIHQSLEDNIEGLQTFMYELTNG